MITQHKNFAPELVSRARVRLLIKQPFFGSLSMRLKIGFDENLNPPTACTDGTSLIFHPAFAAGLSAECLQTLICHELLHCALGHVYRRGHRNAKLFNIAADYVVNLILSDAGFAPIDKWLLDQRFRNMSCEAVYSLLQSEGQTGDEESGPGPGSEPCPTGSFCDPGGLSDDQDGTAPGQAITPLSKSDWEVATAAATRISQAAGKLPAGIARIIEQSRASVSDWRDILRRFVDAQFPSDFSWTSPNRRHIANGVYLPGVIKSGTGAIAVGIDTSGSISQELLAAFSSELTEILQSAKPSMMTVIHCDTKVNHVDTFYPDDSSVTLEMHGGGGTRAKPVFDYVEENRVDPVCLIHFTDLYIGDWDDIPVPDYPVLFITPEHSTMDAPFGEVVRLSLDS